MFQRLQTAWELKQRLNEFQRLSQMTSYTWGRESYSRLIFALESLKSKKKESLYFKDETNRPDSELVSEAEEYELRPRFSAEELAKKEENEAFWKENSESSSDSSMGWKLMWAFFHVTHRTRSCRASFQSQVLKQTIFIMILLIFIRGERHLTAKRI